MYDKTMTLKAAIYDPYLDTLGGGERYCLTVAETLLNKGYSVDLFWSGDKDIIAKAEARFNLNISKINIVPDIFQSSVDNINTTADSESLTKITSHQKQKPNLIQILNNFATKFKVTRQYNVMFFISDWSLPFLFSKNNLLHVQVPFASQKKSKTIILNNLKMVFINKIICNSQFTSKFANQQFGNKCQVIYPPVDTAKFSPNQAKENIILSVGRFDNILNSKKQDVLIECFKKLYQRNKTVDWKLVLAGGSLTSLEDNTYIRHLKTISEDLPIEFYVNASFDTIKSLYEKSKIYWHAAGYGVNQEINPENTEHFGMAPVEAMASGSVPVVINKGGLNEIIQNEVSGFLWNTEEELIAKTQLLISSPQLIGEIQQNAILRSHSFSKESFINNLEKIL